MMQVAIYVNDQLFGTYHAMRLTGMLPLNHSATKLRGLNTIRSVQCSTSGTWRPVRLVSCRNGPCHAVTIATLHRARHVSVCLCVVAESTLRTRNAIGCNVSVLRTWHFVTALSVRLTVPRMRIAVPINATN